MALKACEELPEAETDKKALQVILDKRKNRTQAYFCLLYTSSCV